MIGYLLARGLVSVLCYILPAYECYKTVEKKKADTEKLRFWCRYWILIALLAVFERVGDTLISWAPMYNEAKLALFIYLWYPEMKGSAHIYETYFRPYLAKHEAEIDRTLLEMKNTAGELAVSYFQMAFMYGQKVVYDSLHFILLYPKSGPLSTQQLLGEGTHQPPDQAMEDASKESSRSGEEWLHIEPTSSPSNANTEVTVPASIGSLLRTR